METPSPLSQNALLEHGDILYNMKMLNKSQELKTRELGQTKELSETIRAAKDKIKKLTSGSGRKIRQAEECEAIILKPVTCNRWPITS